MLHRTEISHSIDCEWINWLKIEPCVTRMTQGILFGRLALSDQYFFWVVVINQDWSFASHNVKLFWARKITLVHDWLILLFLARLYIQHLINVYWRHPISSLEWSWAVFKARLEVRKCSAFWDKVPSKNSANIEYLGQSPDLSIPQHRYPGNG